MLRAVSVESAGTGRKRYAPIQHEGVIGRGSFPLPSEERLHERSQMLQRIHPSRRLRSQARHGNPSGDQGQDNHILSAHKQLRVPVVESAPDAGQVHGGAGGLIVRRIICPNSSLSDFYEKSRISAA